MIRQEEQEKAKVLLDEAVMDHSRRAQENVQKSRLEMQQKVEESKEQSEFDRRRAEVSCTMHSVVIRIDRLSGPGSGGYAPSATNSQQSTELWKRYK